MTVWIINHYADPPDGLATRSFDLSLRLVKRGHSVTIFASNFSHYRFANMRRLRPFALWHNETIDGVQFVWVKTFPYRRNDWRRILNMVGFAVVVTIAGPFMRPRPDAVIGVSVHPLAALAGWLLARLRNARFVFEVTDLWPQTLIEFGRLSATSVTVRAMRSLERFLYRRSHRIVMLWRDTASYVSAVAGVEDRIVWIPHVVDPARFSALANYDGAPKRPFVVIFLGGMVKSNCVDVILEAAAILHGSGRDDIRFELIGEGTEKNAIMRRAAELRLTSVVFPQPVPKSEVASVMNRADAFIYGLRDLRLYDYGISMNKVADYLASGRPIIFFGRSSYDPVREAGAGISIPSGEPTAVADAITQLAALPPQERVEMGKRGQAHLARFHDIDVLAAKLLDSLAG